MPLLLGLGVIQLQFNLALLHFMKELVHFF